MKNHKDLLVSCSDDKDCRLWSISRSSCLKKFKGHSYKIWSILILSDKQFVSVSKEIKFWSIDEDENIKTITCDNIISCLTKVEDEIIISGGINYIGTIKM